MEKMNKLKKGKKIYLNETMVKNRLRTSAYQNIFQEYA